MNKLFQKAVGQPDLSKARLAKVMGFDDQSAKLREAIARRDQSIERLKEIVAQRDARIAHLIESRARAVASLSEAIARRNQSIARLKEIVAQRDTRIAHLIESRTRAVASVSRECIPGTSISAKYKNYLRAFGATVPVSTMAGDPGSADLVALRHDVDYDIDIALEMASVEHNLGKRATYYVLHTAPYWDDPKLVEKCLKLQDMGHEVGLHTNVISEWAAGKIESIEGRLAQLLGLLRKGGVTVTGMAAHGDRLCYETGFINYWCFSELRPDDPAADQDGRTAEGLRDPNSARCVTYPRDHTLVRADGATFPLWSISMKNLGIAYDAWHLRFDRYFTDSGGSWSRSTDPIEADLSSGRHQILVHPIHWSRRDK